MIKKPENKGKNVLSKFVSIQMADSFPLALRKTEKFAIDNELSLVGFSGCEAELKKKGIIPENEVLSFTKTDWNPKMKVPPHPDTGREQSASVSYEIFTSSGTKIDKSLCEANTSVQLPLKNRKKYNITLYDEIVKEGFNPFDPANNYFNSRCNPLKDNDTAVVINDRRKQFANISLSCSEGCIFAGLNRTTGYVDCSCTTKDKVAEFGLKVLDSIMYMLNSANIEIIKCVKTAFKYVSYFYLLLA